VNPFVRRLKIAATVEASTFVILLAGVVTRVVFNGPRLGPTIGPIHGAAFIAYMVTVLQARSQRHWTSWRTLVIIFAAVVPIGGYVVAHRLTTAQPPPVKANSTQEVP
jgi:integral membrane protein